MIFRVIVIGVLLMLVMRALRLLVGGVRVGVAGGSQPTRDTAPPVKLVRDPVCGTHVSPRGSLSLTSGGTTHYFCSEECRVKFGRN